MFYGFLSGLLGFGLLMYLLIATAFFCMFRKAHAPLPWLAYVPILQAYPFFRTIRVSQLNFLWYLLPAFSAMSVLAFHIVGAVLSAVATVIYIIVAIRWLYLLLKSFGVSPVYLFGLFGLLIPGLSFLTDVGLVVLLCIMGFHPNIRYRYPDWPGPPYHNRRDPDDQFWF
ncbi:hypothetical protein [Alicyclobacillus acidiphilus]|nr:hypothetical protein [Alicyclobacillus acidiphilus]